MFIGNINKSKNMQRNVLIKPHTPVAQKGADEVVFDVPR